MISHERNTIPIMKGQLIDSWSSFKAQTNYSNRPICTDKTYYISDEFYADKSADIKIVSSWVCGWWDWVGVGWCHKWRGYGTTQWPPQRVLSIQLHRAIEPRNVSAIDRIPTACSQLENHRKWYPISIQLYNNWYNCYILSYISLNQWGREDRCELWGKSRYDACLVCGSSAGVAPRLNCTYLISDSSVAKGEANHNGKWNLQGILSGESMATYIQGDRFMMVRLRKGYAKHTKYSIVFDFTFQHRPLKQIARVYISDRLNCEMTKCGLDLTQYDRLRGFTFNLV